MNILPEQKLDAIKTLLSSERNIICAYLFGSFVRDKINRYSDMDIAVLFDEDIPDDRFTDLQLKLADILSKTLDMQVDIVVLNKALSFLRYQILKEGKRIYERKDRKDHTFETNAILEYLDFKPIKERMEQGLIKSLKEKRWLTGK